MHMNLNYLYIKFLILYKATQLTFFKGISHVCWLPPDIPALESESRGLPWVWGQPGLHSESSIAAWGNKVSLCLKNGKQTNTQKSVTKKETNPSKRRTATGHWFLSLHFSSDRETQLIWTKGVNAFKIKTLRYEGEGSARL